MHSHIQIWILIVLLYNTRTWYTPKWFPISEIAICQSTLKKEAYQSLQMGAGYKVNSALRAQTSLFKDVVYVCMCVFLFLANTVMIIRTPISTEGGSYGLKCLHMKSFTWSSFWTKCSKLDTSGSVIFFFQIMEMLEWHTFKTLSNWRSISFIYCNSYGIFSATKDSNFSASAIF
jgi:hypothetical protein